MENQDNKSKAEQVDADREGWSGDEIARQSSQIDEDEIQRQIKRGDESEGNPDERDNAGKTSPGDTPQGREESKLQTESK